MKIIVFASLSIFVVILDEIFVCELNFELSKIHYPWLAFSISRGSRVSAFGNGDCASSLSRSLLGRTLNLIESPIHPVCQIFSKRSAKFFMLMLPKINIGFVGHSLVRKPSSQSL